MSSSPARTGPAAASRHEGFLRYRHYLWLKVGLLLSGLALLGYGLIQVEPRHNGGSWYGYALGTLAVLLILWLTLLGLRKRAMTSGRWSLKGWTSAHAYLGLALVVVATLHTGFQFGLNVHTLAYALMMVVILSGVYGILAYSVLPAGLSDSRMDMTKAQMVDAVVQLDREIVKDAQPLDLADTELVVLALKEDPFRSGLLRRLSGRNTRSETVRALAEMRRREAEASGDRKNALDAVGNTLERKAAALARIRKQLRLKAMLEVWLYIHVPATFALIAALAAHVVSVFFYW